MDEIRISDFVGCCYKSHKDIIDALPAVHLASTPVTHPKMASRIAPDFLISEMLSDLQIIFCVHKVIRNICNVCVRSVVACGGSVVTCQTSYKGVREKIKLFSP